MYCKRHNHQIRSEYLFFLDSLIEVFQAVDLDEVNNKFAFDYFYGIGNEIPEIYHSQAIYCSVEQALKFAKFHTICSLVDRLEVIAATSSIMTDTVLKQSEEAILFFGNAIKPLPTPASHFFSNPCDRLDLIRELKRSDVGFWQETKPLLMKTLDRKEETGIIRASLIPISFDMALTLEVFSS
jgi:hypothetical protein